MFSFGNQQWNEKMRTKSRAQAYAAIPPKCQKPATPSGVNPRISAFFFFALIVQEVCLKMHEMNECRNLGGNKGF